MPKLMNKLTGEIKNVEYGGYGLTELNSLISTGQWEMVDDDNMMGGDMGKMGGFSIPNIFGDDDKNDGY